MEYEPLHKMFNHNSIATVDLLPADNEEPLRKSYAGAFDALVSDLAAISAKREAHNPSGESHTARTGCSSRAA